MENKTVLTQTGGACDFRSERTRFVFRMNIIPFTVLVSSASVSK
jgi:hypothetical protein